MNEFYPVTKHAKVSELIAQQIKNAILNGTMNPGDRLPSLQELGKLFHASQISVREAIKNLEGNGLIKIKPGSGLFVAQTNPDLMAQSLSSILRIRKTSINELTAARVLFEPIVARVATAEITSDDLLRLEKNIVETSKVIESNSQAAAMNLEFHSIIAEATRNSVIALTMKAMFHVWLEWNLELGQLPSRVEISQRSIDYHKKILEALRQRNSQRVEELMLEHTHHVKRGFDKIQNVENK